MDLELQGSCFQQQTLANGTLKNWQIFNTHGEEIYNLPSKFSMEDNFVIADYAKKYEKIAYFKGRDDMLKKKNMEATLMENKYQKVIQDMRTENDRVSTVLNNLLGAGMNEDEGEDSKIGIPHHMQ